MIRSAEQESLDIFLVSAVLTVLGIRAYLQATNYPKIGGGGLHIAHVLWGGLGMVIAIGILLSFLSPGTRRIAALIGGVGFGAFIDELGKFVTADNNYFFKPTAALVYAVFIALFLVARQLRSFRRLTPKESLVNAIEYSKQLASGRLSVAGRDHALALLAGADPTNPLVRELRQEFLTVPAVPDRSSTLARLASAAQHWYAAIVDNKWFRRVFAGLFVLQAGTVLVRALSALLLAGAAVTGNGDARIAVNQAAHSGFTTWIQAVASLVGGGFALRGVIHLRWSRLRAYRSFELAVLVDLLLAQPLSLLNAGFGGYFEVFFNLALLGTLRFMHAQEHQLLSRAVAKAVPPGKQKSA
jgi:hypothetical protein